MLWPATKLSFPQRRDMNCQLKCENLHYEAPVLALPPLLSATADKGVRAQSFHSNSVSCIITPPLLKYFKDTACPRTKNCSYPHTRTHTSSISYTRLAIFLSRIISLFVKIEPIKTANQNDMQSYKKFLEKTDYFAYFC